MDAVDSSGRMPQHLADMEGYQDVVRLLEALPSQGPLTPALLAVTLARLGFQASSG